MDELLQNMKEHCENGYVSDIVNIDDYYCKENDLGVKLICDECFCRIMEWKLKQRTDPIVDLQKQLQEKDTIITSLQSQLSITNSKLNKVLMRLGMY